MYFLSEKGPELKKCVNIVNFSDSGTFCVWKFILKADIMKNYKILLQKMREGINPDFFITPPKSGFYIVSAQRDDIQKTI